VVANNADADMLLTWHLVTEERAQRTYDANAARYNPCWHCGLDDSVRVTQYTRGTLIVDLLDPVQMQSVWRSVLESRMREQRDLEQAAETRGTAVEAIFVGFPPG
jgi:hypothetical protein